jgi:hypothetical protein
MSPPARCRYPPRPPQLWALAGGGGHFTAHLTRYHSSTGVSPKPSIQYHARQCGCFTSRALDTSQPAIVVLVSVKKRVLRLDEPALPAALDQMSDPAVREHHILKLLEVFELDVTLCRAEPGQGCSTPRPRCPSTPTAVPPMMPRYSGTQTSVARPAALSTALQLLPSRPSCGSCGFVPAHTDSHIHFAPPARCRAPGPPQEVLRRPCFNLRFTD